jgi:hypothetical protein
MVVVFQQRKAFLGLVQAVLQIGHFFFQSIDRGRYVHQLSVGDVEMLPLFGDQTSMFSDSLIDIRRPADQSGEKQIQPERAADQPPDHCEGDKPQNDGKDHALPDRHRVQSKAESVDPNGVKEVRVTAICLQCSAQRRLDPACRSGIRRVQDFAKPERC